MTPLTKYPGTNYSLEEQCIYALYNNFEPNTADNFEFLMDESYMKLYPIHNVSML